PETSVSAPHGAESLAIDLRGRFATRPLHRVLQGDNMRKQSLHVAIAALLAGYAAGNAPVAYSQQGGAAAPGGLEEIVVTASRREQNLQDVPLAVVALTGDMLERQSIENMEGLKAIVPHLVVAGNLGG